MASKRESLEARARLVWPLVPLLCASIAFPANWAAGRKVTSAWPVLPPAGPSDRVLVFAPHVDDEAIAVGGFLADAVRRKAEVWVVYMTAGDNNRTSAKILELTLGPSREDLLKLGERRIREARVAMRRVGVPADHLFLLGYPDRGLRWMLDHPAGVLRSPGTGRSRVPYAEALSPGSEHRLSNLQDDVRQVLARVRPTLAFLPVDFDAHPDHGATARIVLPLLAEVCERPSVWGYLVHARDYPRPFFPSTRSRLEPPRSLSGLPWVVFPLSPAQEVLKGRTLTAYRSQRADPYLLLLTDAFIRRNELFLPLAP